MTVVDSCGWLEYLTDGRNANFFAPHLLDEKNLLVPSLVVFEVFKRLTILNQTAAASAFLRVVQRCQVESLSAEELANAAVASHRYQLAMADAIIWHTARLRGAKLYTQDAAFDGLPDVVFQAK
jgi:toxin FitB